MTTRRRLLMVAALLMLSGAGGARAELPQSPEERRLLEERVEQLEREFRAAREEALARCRGGWTTCTNQRCRQIPKAETTRWQACQTHCDATYERCRAAAESIWPGE